MEKVAYRDTQLLWNLRFQFGALFDIREQRVWNQTEWTERVPLRFRASLHFLAMLLFPVHCYMSARYIEMVPAPPLRESGSLPSEAVCIQLQMRRHSLLLSHSVDGLYSLWTMGSANRANDRYKRHEEWGGIAFPKCPKMLYERGAPLSGSENAHLYNTRENWPRKSGHNVTQLRNLILWLICTTLLHKDYWRLKVSYDLSE